MTMSKLHYLAYGSNLHPLRLSERVPSARLRGVVELPGYRLAFHACGEDCSGKGNLVACREGAAAAYGAIYEIAAAEKPLLDRFEGAAYRSASIDVIVAGVTCTCFTYFAETAFIDEGLKPYDWYKKLVWLGARYLGVPEDYVTAIDQVLCVPDPDDERARHHAALLSRMGGGDES